VGESLRVYGHLLRAQVRGFASYRVSFLTDLVTNGLVPLFDLIAILAMFRVTRSLGGFTAGEVLVMYGLSATSFALGDLAVGNIERVNAYVRTGTLDAILLRPLSVLGQLVTMDFSIRRATRIATAVVILAVALSTVQTQWTVGRVVFLVLAPLSGAVFFASVFVATATVAFWWIDSGELANGFTYGGRDFTSYPLTVYSGYLRWLFGFGLGFASVGYYPTLALLDRPDPLGLPGWVGWCAPAVSLVTAGVATLAWRAGVRQYRSTGS
jgi:ABC-2 type transport system permease protein